jgi:hypothetical protein
MFRWLGCPKNKASRSFVIHYSPEIDRSIVPILLIFTINTMTYVKSLPGEKEGSQGKTGILFCPV